MGIDVVATVPGLLPAALGTGEAATGGFVVAEIEPARAEALRRNVTPNIVIEENHRLSYGDKPIDDVATRGSLRLAAAGMTQSFPVKLRIVGRGGAPIEGAVVQLASDGLSEGRTDANGVATVTLFLAPGGRARLLYVDVPLDHWDILVHDPAITPGQSYELRAKSVFEAPELLPNFPGDFRFGWGQRLMELDRMPAEFDGTGVRIAIIDSGADPTHPLLQHIKQGFDATQPNIVGGNWAQDSIGHGTHCAGVITARPTSGHAMRGFAPGAEVIVFKIFPGGDFTALALCIRKCIELQVDVVNLSLGAAVSQNVMVDQQLDAAVKSGVAFIVAAGNSGDDVQFPASSRYSLAVAALGAQGVFPESTYDESTFDPTLPMDRGLFSPNFTCHGPRIAVTAPGVSIVSSVPNGYNPESGTSMAAPHVTGLAALLLAHHPMFRVQFRERNAARVNALYQLIHSICAPVALGPDRAGAGIPRLGSLIGTLLPAQQPGTGDRTITPELAASLSTIFGAPGVQPGFLVPQAVGGPLFVPQHMALGAFGQK